jgi:ADP-ribose pyrophosphatase YjhB (NUDIX family)
VNESLAPQWLVWAREIQALSQTGRTYAENEYQRQRYDRLTEIAADIVSQHSGLPAIGLAQIFKDQTGYATPKVDVRGAVFREGKLLMVRERMDGGWCMPGGWADVGDVPSQAAEREVWEEAGFYVRAKRVVGVYDANRMQPMELFHAFKIIFLCELIDGQARPSSETSEVAFFGSDEIPQTLSGERTRPRQITDAFACVNDPERPTVFD